MEIKKALEIADEGLEVLAFGVYLVVVIAMAPLWLPAYGMVRLGRWVKSGK